MLVLASMLSAACGADAPKPASTSSVVIHTLASGSDDPPDIFKSTPAGPASPPPSGTVSGGERSAQAFVGAPTVGAVFLGAGNVVSLHYCTASVVDSAAGDLIVTAAHCVYNSMFGGYQNHILFVPGYHDQTAPYGTWIATRAVLDQRWVASSDPDADVAFLTVRRVGGGGASLESATGANRLRSDPGYANDVDVIAYTLTAERPVSCDSRTSEQSATQLRFDCGGFADGSSGAPFLTIGGDLVGVLGGYEQGGDTPQTSYSSYFGTRILALYKAATGAP